jgi:hypothetical protein
MLHCFAHIKINVDPSIQLTILASNNMSICQNHVKISESAYAKILRIITCWFTIDYFLFNIIIIIGQMDICVYF